MRTRLALKQANKRIQALDAWYGQIRKEFGDANS